MLNVLHYLTNEPSYLIHEAYFLMHQSITKDMSPLPIVRESAS